MGRKPIDKLRIDNPELREDWVRQVAPHFFMSGLGIFNMNEISTLLDVSKATLYKHYATHLEVLEEMVDMRVSLVAEFDMLLFDTNLDYWTRYKNALTFISSSLSDVSATFQNDLREQHPFLYDRLKVLQNYIIDRLRVFYNEGIEEGVIADYDPRFLAISDHQFILCMCEPTFLAQNSLTLQAAINAYFTIKLKGIFKQTPASNEQPTAVSA